MKAFNSLFLKIPLRFFMIALLISSISLLVPASLFATGKKLELKIYKSTGGDFTLTDHHGSKVHLKDYRGKVVLIFFGYTYCPDVCPTTLVDLQQVMKRLGKQTDQVQTFFISVDPDRDTPERLKEFITYFDPSFMGLTGTTEEITKVAKQYKTKFIREEIESAAGYFFAHSSSVFLIDKQGRLRGRFKTKWESEKLVAGIKQLIAI